MDSIFYPVTIAGSWEFRLLRAASATGTLFDLDFLVAAAQALCILPQVVPPLYGFFQLTPLILSEEAERGQLLAWRNIRPDKQQLQQKSESLLHGAFFPIISTEPLSKCKICLALHLHSLVTSPFPSQHDSNSAAATPHLSAASFTCAQSTWQSQT